MPRIHINPKVSVSVVFVAAMFMNIMDITIVNVALPSIGHQFGVAETALDAVAVGYLVSLAVFIPAAGWLGDRFGSKRVLLFAIAVFTGASVLCGLADSLTELVAFAFGLIFLDEHRQPLPGRFDLPGFLLSGIGFAAVMYGVSEGPDKGWHSAQILGSLILGAILLAWLVRVEMRTPRPLLKLRLFGNRLFRSTSVVLMFAMAAFLGVLFAVPLFFQIALGLNALQSGLNTFPEAIGVMIGAQLASRLFYPRIGPRRLVAAGLVGVACSVGLMSLVGFDTDLWWMRLLMLTMGLSMAQVIVSSQAASFATVSHADTGNASSLFNSQRQLGSALGVSLVTTVIAAVGAVHVVAGRTVPNLTAYHAAFLTAAGVALAGAAVALTINDADAAATMVRRTVARVTPAGGGRPATIT